MTYVLVVFVCVCVYFLGLFELFAVCHSKNSKNNNELSELEYDDIGSYFYNDNNYDFIESDNINDIFDNENKDKDSKYDDDDGFVFEFLNSFHKDQFRHSKNDIPSKKFAHNYDHFEAFDNFESFKEYNRKNPNNHDKPQKINKDKVTTTTTTTTTAAKQSQSQSNIKGYI